MTPEDQEKILKAAVETFGVETQLNTLIEEMAELTVAIQHLRRKRGSWADVMTETADVSVMLEQLPYIIAREAGGTVQEARIDIYAHKQNKLERLRKRIENE